MNCIWCGEEFEPRNRNGIPREFCAEDCRAAFNTKARQVGAKYLRGTWQVTGEPLQDAETTIPG